MGDDRIYEELVQRPARPSQDHELPQGPSKRKLYICADCGHDFVRPLDWSEEGPRHWRIVLGCMECDHIEEGVFEQSAVEALDDELDRTSSQMLGDARRLTHLNMSEEIEKFVGALTADAILPDDFDFTPH